MSNSSGWVDLGTCIKYARSNWTEKEAYYLKGEVKQCRQWNFNDKQL